mmetsp:Transcript_101674/g.254929  ORF Transcript_101674/g.254929 Transcript_101674/m.254929 type:complete len:212 (-) Transcript_101674:581-1216(-)
MSGEQTILGLIAGKFRGTASFGERLLDRQALRQGAVEAGCKEARTAIMNLRGAIHNILNPSGMEYPSNLLGLASSQEQERTMDTAASPKELLQASQGQWPCVLAEGILVLFQNQAVPSIAGMSTDVDPQIALDYCLAHGSDRCNLHLNVKTAVPGLMQCFDLSCGVKPRQGQGAGKKVQQMLQLFDVSFCCLSGSLRCSSSRCRCVRQPQR